VGNASIQRSKPIVLAIATVFSQQYSIPELIIHVNLCNVYLRIQCIAVFARPNGTRLTAE